MLFLQVIETTIDPSFLFQSGIGSILDRISVAEQLSVWIENTQSPDGDSSLLQILSDEADFYLSMSKQARKTNNLRSAERHLRSHIARRFAGLCGLSAHSLDVRLTPFVRRRMLSNWRRMPSELDISLLFVLAKNCLILKYNCRREII